MKVKELFEEIYSNVTVSKQDVKNGKIIHDYTNDKVDDFRCSRNGLTSLEHCPTKTDDFYCSKNNLTSLEYGPTKTNTYYCPDNKLTSLEHCATQVGIFWCSNNELTSLEHCPTETKDFNCCNNQLKNLERCANVINGDFLCRDNKISSLKGIGKDYCLKASYLDLVGNPLTSNVLGLLKIEALTEVLMDNKEVEKIIDKHLEYKDIAKCRQELIEAGLKEFAKL